MDELQIEMKSPSYEEAYRKLHTAFIVRLKNSIEAIDNILSQRQMRPLSKDDMASAQHMAHGLAGSGTTFGFPEVTAAGQKADIFIDKVLKKMTTDKPVDDESFAELEKTMLTLRTACERALEQKETGEVFSTASAEAQRKPSQPFQILVVDDDEHIGDFLAMKLQQRNMQVIVVRDGESAMNSMKKKRPDLIVLDISMPGMNGHDVLRRVKQDSDLVNIPVLMLTAQADQKDVVSALHSGAIDYIIKPFDPEKLLSRVEKILDAARYTVLIADNDPLILQLLESKFRYAGCRIVMVEDGSKAWEKIERSLPDIVILDRMMPGLEGLAVLKKMREEKATQKIPVIILSARKEDRDIDIGMKMGAQKYMVKPFLPDDLVDETFRQLGQKK